MSTRPAQRLADLATGPAAETTRGTVAGIGQHVLRFLRSGLVIFAFLALLALAWRALDLYEVEVKARAVSSRIEMERHSVWMDEVRQARASRGGSTPEAIQATLAAQTAGMPATTSIAR